jgi:hypothetical protein
MLILFFTKIVEIHFWGLSLLQPNFPYKYSFFWIVFHTHPQRIENPRAISNSYTSTKITLTSLIFWDSWNSKEVHKCSVEKSFNETV